METGGTMGGRDEMTTTKQIEKEFLTITELAEETDIAETTVRRYLNTFEEFFISNERKRNKKYDPMAIKVLQRIRDLYENGSDKKEIQVVLGNEFFVTVDENNEEKPDISREIVVALEEQKELTKKLFEALQRQEIIIQQQGQMIQQLLENQEQQKQIATTTEEERANNEPKEIVEKVEKKGFFQRIFGKA